MHHQYHERMFANEREHGIPVFPEIFLRNQVINIDNSCRAKYPVKRCRKENRAFPQNQVVCQIARGAKEREGEDPFMENDVFAAEIQSHQEKNPVLCKGERAEVFTSDNAGGQGMCDEMVRENVIATEHAHSTRIVRSDMFLRNGKNKSITR